MEIWCLFGVENAYERSESDFITWWSKKPDFETLAKALGVEFRGDETILNVVNIHQGAGRRIGNVDYNLSEIEEGK